MRETRLKHQVLVFSPLAEVKESVCEVSAIVANDLLELQMLIANRVVIQFDVLH